MKNKIAVQVLTRTALLLALTVVIQQFKTISQFITGPIVNAILICATVFVGTVSGMFIAVVSPILAAIINPSPLLTALPQMVPAIILGNVAIVAMVALLKRKNIILAMTTGAFLKAFLLWAGVSYVVIPYFGQNLKPAMKTAAMAMFSYNQLITALIGGVISYIIIKTIKHKI